MLYGIKLPATVIYYWLKAKGGGVGCGPVGKLSE